MSLSPRYKVGDTVFYPSAGVGVIEAVEDLFLTGKQERCFVIRIHESHVTIKVPQANMANNGIRPLLEGKRIKELFKVLSAASQRRATGNLTERCKGIAHKINAGSPIELGEVVRDLTHWKVTSGLSFDETRLLETASNYLSRELATVEGISTEDAYARIRSQIEVSVV